MNEVNALLNGERINKKYTYRSCYLLAKYFKSLGYEHIKIRQEIFNWANKYGITIVDDLNSIIQKAFKDKKQLISNVEIKVSKEDIDEIVKRFDKYNTRLTAFAILCFAKRYADKNGMFYISLIALSNWIGIDQTALSSRYINELIDFGYIKKVTENERNKRLKSRYISKTIIYKIKVNYKNEGSNIIKDYNIRKEFEEIIANYGYTNLCI